MLNLSATRLERSQPHVIRARGITLIETLLAVAVGAMIIVGSVLMYMVAIGNDQVAQANQQVQAIISGVRTLYAGHASYNSLSNEVGRAARIFPPGMVIEGSTAVVNPWKGDVTLDGEATDFRLIFERVPQDACARLVAMNTTGMGGGVIDVTVNGNAETPPIDVGEAVVLCNADSEPHNTVAWRVR